MIGRLPTCLKVNGTDYRIRTDYRTALVIFQAYADPELSDTEKTMVMLGCLYEELENIPADDLNEAARQAAWFLDGGPFVQTEQTVTAKKVMDWEQDEQMIFSAVNKVAGYEVRTMEYLHWWTFLGYFNEIGEGLFSTVVAIRDKQNRGKPLEKQEQEFYRKNKSLVDLKTRYTQEELEEQAYWNSLLG